MDNEALDAWFAQAEDVLTDWHGDTDAMYATAPAEDDAGDGLPELADSYYAQSRGLFGDGGLTVSVWLRAMEQRMVIAARTQAEAVERFLAAFHQVRDHDGPVVLPIVGPSPFAAFVAEDAPTEPTDRVIAYRDPAGMTWHVGDAVITDEMLARASYDPLGRAAHDADAGDMVCVELGVNERDDEPQPSRLPRWNAEVRGADGEWHPIGTVDADSFQPDPETAYRVLDEGPGPVFARYFGPRRIALGVDPAWSPSRFFTPPPADCDIDPNDSYLNSDWAFDDEPDPMRRALQLRQQRNTGPNDRRGIDGHYRRRQTNR